MRIARIARLPDDIARLADLAAREGHQHLKRLVEEFDSGVNRFQSPGEGLFEVRDSAQTLVAIGGLNIDPYTPGQNAGRLRRESTWMR